MAVVGKVTDRKNKKDVLWVEEKAGVRHRAGRICRKLVSGTQTALSSVPGHRTCRIHVKGTLGQRLCSNSLSPSVNKIVHGK